MDQQPQQQRPTTKAMVEEDFVNAWKDLELLLPLCAALYRMRDRLYPKMEALLQMVTVTCLADHDKLRYGTAAETDASGANFGKLMLDRVPISDARYKALAEKKTQSEFYEGLIECSQQDPQPINQVKTAVAVAFALYRTENTHIPPGQVRFPQYIILRTILEFPQCYRDAVFN
jgi:hypothetical protein